MHLSINKPIHNVIVLILVKQDNDYNMLNYNMV
jgi:hypothetical protein